LCNPTSKQHIKRITTAAPGKNPHPVLRIIPGIRLNCAAKTRSIAAAVEIAGPCLTQGESESRRESASDCRKTPYHADRRKLSDGSERVFPEKRYGSIDFEISGLS
jgi:hypothetical protein